jgi:hypothetical protein
MIQSSSTPMTHLVAPLANRSPDQSRPLASTPTQTAEARTNEPEEERHRARTLVCETIPATARLTEAASARLRPHPIWTSPCTSAPPS